MIAGIFLLIIFVIYVRVVGNEDRQSINTYMGKEILIAYDFSTQQTTKSTDSCQTLPNSN